MKAYAVQYKLYDGDEVRLISFLAKNKYEAWKKANYEIIPRMHNQYAYSSWVVSVTYNNGNCRYFNTFEGNPY